MSTNFHQIFFLCLSCFSLPLLADDSAPKVVGKLPSGKIVFMFSNSSKQHAVFSLSKENVLQRLWKGSGDNEVISISRDGKKIIFGSETEPKILDLTSNVITTLPPNTFQPDLSPDGLNVVSASFDWQTGISSMQIQEIGGTNKRTLLSGKGHIRFPSWSPDGSKILFTSTLEGPPLAPSVWIMNADGSNKVNISNNTETCWSPSWSHDGSHIAWAGERPTKVGTPYDIRNIAISKSDGTDQKDLKIRSEDKTPSWSPDGKWIAFISTQRTYGAAASVGLWIMSSDGSNRAELLQIFDGDAIGKISWTE